MPQQVLMAPRRPLEAMPTYRLIDVLRWPRARSGGAPPDFAGKMC